MSEKIVYTGKSGRYHVGYVSVTYSGYPGDFTPFYTYADLTDARDKADEEARTNPREVWVVIDTQKEDNDA